MKRKRAEVEIKTDLRTVEDIINDPPQFIANWPYVVKVRGRDPVEAEIMLPRFIFKFRDEYTFRLLRDEDYLYDGTGKKSRLLVRIRLREWLRYVSAVVELSYSGRGEFFLGKTLEMLAQGIADNLKELAEASRPTRITEGTERAILQVDFSDPMSVANFLAKAKMVHSGLYMIERGALPDMLAELKFRAGSEVLYVSGVTSDGSRSFKVLLRGNQVVAVEVRDGARVETVKVEGDTDAERAMELLRSVEGSYMLNVWVPAGGV